MKLLTFRSTLAIAATVLAGVAQAQTDVNDWPTYNHDVRGTRHNPGETALGRGNVGRLVEKWKFPAADTQEEIGVIHATPAVVRGCVYFGTVNHNPTFYKLAPDGTLHWSYRNPAYAQTEAPAEPARDCADKPIVRLQPSDEGGIFSSALVTDDLVFFGDMGGWFYGLDRKTGAERWKLNARGDEFPGALPLNVGMASPILAGDKLIVAGGTLEQLIAAIPGYKCCEGRGFVAALAPSTGRVLWKYDVGPKPEPLDPPIIIKDGFGEHVFHSGPTTSSVWCTPSFDAESGTIFFGTDVNTAPRRPTDEDPHLYTRESCAVIALNATDGREKWVTQLNPGDVWTNAMPAYDPKEGRYKDQSIGDTPKIFSISVDGKPTKVVGVGCKNGGFYVLKADDGQIVAQTPRYTGPPAYPLQPKPDDRMVALPSPIGGLQTGCATDGESIFTNGIDALWLAAVATTNPSDIPNYLIEHGPVTAGRVVALSLDTQTEHWRHERPRVAALGGPPPKHVFTDAGDPVASGIAVANGVVYFTAVASGKLVALDASSGEVLKEIELGPVWSGPSVSRGRVYVGTGNTQFTPTDYEAFFPKKYTGVLYCFGLPGDDEVAGLGGEE